MSTLHDRVAIVTGASRGIGRAIVMGLAKAGCRVVIAAKSTTSTEKLPGSIYTVAAEAEALGSSRPERLHHDVGPRRQVPHESAVCGIVEVGHDALLPSHEDRPRAELSERGPAGRLDLGHLRAEVGEQDRRERRGQPT